jgi:endoglucanase
MPSFRFSRLVRLAVVVFAVFCVADLHALAVSGYVRVNQIGYEAALPARAYLMTSAAVSGVTFVVKNSGGKVVASGDVGTSSGTWGTYSVYPIDFKLSAADTYTISVQGAVSAVSPGFRVDTPANLYTTPLANNLYFYENERDGPDFIPTPLRTAPGHLNDAKAAVYLSPKFDDDDNIIGSLTRTGENIDAEGGWWDAGDYLKFVQTHSYVTALMLVGVRDFPNQMGSGSNTSNFTNEAGFGIDWLLHMWHDSTSTLYYQVGIGTDFEDFDYLSDHDIWRLPQVDDAFGNLDPVFKYIRHRPVFEAGPAGSKISPNLAGRLAASFAECFQVFQATNTGLADRCIFAAEHVFDLADTAPKGNLVTTAPFDFYPEGEWRDDLELGATELYFALQHGNLPAGLPHTQPNFYLKAGAQWAHAYINSPGGGDTLNLYDLSGLAHFELYRAMQMAGNPAGLAVTQQQLLDDMAGQISGSVANNGNDPFGFGLAWGTYDSISHGTGLAVMTAELNYLRKNRDYDTDSRRWLANVSGANAWGVSFTVGDGEVFPDCMQHQVANLAGSLNGQPPVLAGAVVEGANSFPTFGIVNKMMNCPPGAGDVFRKFNGNGAVYKDNVQSYSTDEPAIDLTASSFLMYAWRIAGAPAQQ